jgi:hypothetical protein
VNHDAPATPNKCEMPASRKRRNKKSPTVIVEREFFDGIVHYPFLGWLTHAPEWPQASCLSSGGLAGRITTP